MRGLKLDLNNNFHSSPVALVRNKKNLDGIWKQEEPKLLLVPVPFLWAKKRPATSVFTSHRGYLQRVKAASSPASTGWPAVPGSELKAALNRISPSFPFLWGLGKGFGWPKPAATCPPEVLSEGLLRWLNPAPAAFQPSSRGMGHKQQPRCLVWATQTSHCYAPIEPVWELAPGEEARWP